MLFHLRLGERESIGETKSIVHAAKVRIECEHSATKCASDSHMEFKRAPT